MCISDSISSSSAITLQSARKVGRVLSISELPRSANRLLSQSKGRMSMKLLPQAARRTFRNKSDMRTRCIRLLFSALALGGLCLPVHGFVGHTALVRRRPHLISTLHQQRYRRYHRPGINVEQLWSTSADNESPVVGVVAPLKYMGPYPCLTLCFPTLATPEQRAHNLTGISLDFVLDTGANVNSIGTRLADELALQISVSSKDLNILGSAGVGGTFLAGDVFLLGDCQLGGLPQGQNVTFMTNLTAAALPHPSPVGDGLLSLSFFLSFPAGVEFDWYGTDGDPPTVIFYYGNELRENVKAGLTRVPLDRLAVQVLSLTINVNGTDMPALLDTGAPITILSHQAAKQAGIETVPERLEQPVPQRRQAYGDDALMVRGVDNGHVCLSRSVSSVPIRAGEVSLGEGPVYVGDLPGLTLMGGLSNSSLPAVILGLDSLRRTHRMILRVSENELWFEELPKS